MGKNAIRGIIMARYQRLDIKPSIEQKQQESESLVGYLARTGARTVARGAETILGLPGDIVSGVSNLANAGISAVTGQPGPIPERASLNYPMFGALGEAVDVGARLLGQESPIPRVNLPTSQDIKENVTQRLTGEKLEPQTSGEQAYDEIISDATALLLPTSGKVPGFKSIGRALGISSVGNLAKWATEDITDSPLLGTGVKMGAMVLAGTAGGRKALETQKNVSYKQAYESIPEKATIPLNQTKRDIDKFKRHLKKSDNKAVNFIKDRIDALEELIEDEGLKPSVKSVIDLKQGWNSHFSEATPKERSALGKIVNILKDDITKYGKTNPGFYTPYQVGEELTGALRGSDYLKEFLSKNKRLQESIKDPFLKKFLTGVGVSAGAAASYALGIKGTALAGAALGAAGSAGQQISKTVQLFAKSLHARSYYKELVQNALAGNVSAAARDLARLNKVTQDFAKKNPDSKKRYTRLDI